MVIKMVQLKSSYKFDVISFYKDYNIDFKTEGEDHHCRTGWVQTQCPYCDSFGSYHLGFNLKNNFYSCWKCGYHPIEEITSLLTNTEEKSVWKIIKLYKNKDSLLTEEIKPIIVKKEILQLPIGTSKMTQIHKDYLISRKFDPDKLESIYGLQGTNHLGNYKFRIIAPIYHKEVLVSYQGRDVTNKSKLRYKTCSIEDEVRHHKHCLYALDSVQGGSILVVEGITGVWRLGPGSVATFGIKFTLEQAKLLTKFKRRFIAFDPEPQATIQAEKLAHLSSTMGGESILVELYEEGLDPGDLSQEKANDIMKELGF